MKITAIHTQQIRHVNGKPLKGYTLQAENGQDVAFIHADASWRVSNALDNQRRIQHATPQAFMRALLNAEDFNSPVYDAIFRVYYEGEFEVPGTLRYANGLKVTDTKGDVRLRETET